MIRGLYTASAGMQVEQVRQEIIANNLANLNTSGFRRDLAVLEARQNMAVRRTGNPTSADPNGPSRRTGIGELGTGVLVNRIVKRFEQGSLRQTDDPFDMALEGDGYFTLQTPQGQTIYSRAGEFTRDKTGTLVDKAGNALVGSNGPVRVPQGTSFNVAVDGSMSVSGTPIGKLSLARFDNPDADLEKVGDTAFRFRGQGQPPAGTAEVQQGMLEGPNVNGVQEMVEMIAALRQYESNQKSLQAHDETLEKAVNEVGKM